MALTDDPAELAKLLMAQSGGNSMPVPEGTGDLRAKIIAALEQYKSAARSPSFVPKELSGLAPGIPQGIVPQTADVPRFQPPQAQPLIKTEGKTPAIPQEDMFKSPSFEDITKKPSPVVKPVPPVTTPPGATTGPSTAGVATPPPAMTPMQGPDTGEPNPNVSPPTQQAFVQMMTPHVLEVAKATGLDPKLVMAQAILESGAGASAPGHNYFGIKGTPGAENSQELATKEMVKGKLVPTKAWFRKYASPQESAQHYAELMKGNSIYAPVLAAKGLEAQLAALGRSGYATDSDYANKLRRIIAKLSTIEAQPTEPDTRKRGGRIESSGRHARDLLALSRGYR